MWPSVRAPRQPASLSGLRVWGRMAAPLAGEPPAGGDPARAPVALSESLCRGARGGNLLRRGAHGAGLVLVARMRESDHTGIRDWICRCGHPDTQHRRVTTTACRVEGCFCCAFDLLRIGRDPERRRFLRALCSAREWRKLGRALAKAL